MQYSGQHEQIKLSEVEELAALSGFLASLPQNVVPPHVDPSQPLDPQLILDFDTRGSRAQEEVISFTEDVWARNPVFLYAKVCAWCGCQDDGLLTFFMGFVRWP